MLTVPPRALSTISLVIMWALGCQPSPSERETKADVELPPPLPRESTRPLSLPGITIELPEDFVELDPAQHERMVESAQRAVPPGSTGRTELLGRRAPDGIGGGFAYVQRQTLVSGFVPPGLTARDALQAELDELPAQLSASGLQVSHLERDERDRGLEACVTAKGERGDASVTMSLCSLGLVDPEQRFVFLTCGCVGDRSQCSSILAGRRYQPPEVLPLDHELTPTPSPGLPGLREDGLGWLRFGMSREEFRAACRDGGQRVDGFDWATDGPVPKRWFDAGLISRCSGLDVPIGPGNVIKLDATFSPDDALGVANLRVDASLDVMRGALSVAYPDTWTQGDHLLHFVDREAQGHQVVSIGTSPTAIPGAGIIVTIFSRAGKDMPMPR